MERICGAGCVLQNPIISVETEDSDTGFKASIMWVDIITKPDIDLFGRRNEDL